MEPIITDVINIIEEGRRKAYKAINTSMVESYWLAGKRIIESVLDENIFYTLCRKLTWSHNRVIISNGRKIYCATEV